MRTYREGELLVFDDSWEHEARAPPHARRAEHPSTRPSEWKGIAADRVRSRAGVEPPSDELPRRAARALLAPGHPAREVRRDEAAAQADAHATPPSDADAAAVTMSRLEPARYTSRVARLAAEQQ